MALLADGWHMGTHAAALGIALFAYIYARRHANDPGYAFGTGKVSVLGGFTSAVVLLLIALLMAVESLQRLISPQAIRFNEAILVAGLGLAVNLFSAFLLQDQNEQHHEGHQEHVHAHGGQDHNLRAAYLHVLADALTSILAIFALLTGKSLGWIWMDALMGIVGAVVITRWSFGLLHDTSQILLDAHPIHEFSTKVKDLLEGDGDNLVFDLHIWWVGTNQFAAAISLVTHFPQPVEHYKALLSGCGELAHVTIEVNVYQSDR
jgi:cation diffusion facilitator family transporter